MYRTLDSEQIVTTTHRLRERVEKRFPDAGLAKVAAELSDVAKEAQARCETFRKANLPLRVGILFLILIGVGGLVLLFTQVKSSEGMWKIENFMEEFEAALGSIFFIGAAAIFLVTVENRIKRNRALEAIKELRALAHIVDMHQLTKDPEPILNPDVDSDGYAGKKMSAYELGRYYDYCSELLSITSKIGALYVQNFSDPVALSAVDEVETLTTGLSRKIWQKMMVLDLFRTKHGERR